MASLVVSDVIRFMSEIETHLRDNPDEVLVKVNYHKVRRYRFFPQTMFYMGAKDASRAWSPLMFCRSTSINEKFADGIHDIERTSDDHALKTPSVLVSHSTL